MGNVIVTSDENSAKNWRYYFSSFAFVFFAGKRGCGSGQIQTQS
jgi:hypothetical protein